MSDMTSISVFTPSHNPQWLDECYESLLAQDHEFTDWEWVVVLSDGARWAAPSDKRVKVFTVDQLHGVGACKSYAVEHCTGEMLVELDHDDWLAPGALEVLARAFDEYPDAGLIYSDFAHVDASGKPDVSVPFDPAYGWTYRVDGKHLAVNALDAEYPQNASVIWYAPNHVRAFTRSAYEKAGGYDWHRDVLDDQDLMCRLYQIGEFVRIPECLYYQRVHDSNTQRRADVNGLIQTGTVDIRDNQIGPMALAWSRRHSLVALDLGAAHGKQPGYLGVDQYAGPGVDITGDIFDVLSWQEDNSVGVIRAVDFLEHITDRVRLFNEIHRVLAHGGLLLSLTPSTDGRGAFQDPTHVSFYNENAFWYFTRPEVAAYVPQITARFQVSTLDTIHPSDWHLANRLPYVRADLVALKDGGPRQGGICNW